jgi:hypothetical protein
MAAVWRRTRAGVEGRVEPAEAELLRTLLTDLDELLAPTVDSAAGEPDPLARLTGLDGAPRPAPTDPGLARLLPDAYRDDPAAAAEYRRYAEDDVRAAKRAAAARMLASLPAAGGRLRLDEEAARAWLAALNDLRLVLGTRLSITEDPDGPDWPDGDPRWVSYELYHWLTMLQDSLVTAVAGW